MLKTHHKGQKIIFWLDVCCDKVSSKSQLCLFVPKKSIHVCESQIAGVRHTPVLSGVSLGWNPCSIRGPMIGN